MVKESVKKCDCCGKLTRLIIKCPHCIREVCLTDFNCTKGLCVDCLVLEYQEKYFEKIEAYRIAI